MKFTTKQKIFLSVAFIVSLLPMCTSQYGIEGVSEPMSPSGLMNLLNPIGIISVILFFVGLWVPFKGALLGKILSLLGVIGIVVSEVSVFIMADSPNSYISLGHSFEYANTFFYLGLFTSLLMIFIYGCFLSLSKDRTNSKTRSRR